MITISQSNVERIVLSKLTIAVALEEELEGLASIEMPCDPEADKDTDDGDVPPPGEESAGLRVRIAEVLMGPASGEQGARHAADGHADERSLSVMLLVSTFVPDGEGKLGTLSAYRHAGVVAAVERCLIGIATADPADPSPGQQVTVVEINATDSQRVADDENLSIERSVVRGTGRAVAYTA